MAPYSAIHSSAPTMFVLQKHLVYIIGRSARRAYADLLFVARGYKNILSLPSHSSSAISLVSYLILSCSFTFAFSLSIHSF